jgi:hypothetical protein
MFLTLTFVFLDLDLNLPFHHLFLGVIIIKQAKKLSILSHMFM